MKLTVSSESWPLERPFAISRGVKTAADVVVVSLEADGTRARAECVPYPRYGETVEGVVDEIESLRVEIEQGLTRTRLTDSLHAGAARNAVDCAFWDWEAKRAGKRVWELAGLAMPAPQVTAATIGLGAAEEMGARAKEMAGHPLLKVKLDAADVLPRLEAVKAGAPNARLVVDPNEGWDVAMVRDLNPRLHELGVEMLEQPVPADDDEGLRDIFSLVPLCADEACHTSADLDRLRGLYDMINIKLDKTGGLTEALYLADAAAAKGFGLMIGCMVGTSLAMAPATLLAPRCRVVDLDGPLLLREDRESGLEFTEGKIHRPDAALWG